MSGQSDGISRRTLLFGIGGVALGGYTMDRFLTNDSNPAPTYPVGETPDGYGGDGRETNTSTSMEPDDQGNSTDTRAAGTAPETVELCEDGYKIHGDIATDYGLPVDDPDELHPDDDGMFGLLYHEDNGAWSIAGVGTADETAAQNSVDEDAVREVVADWIDGDIPAGPNGLQSYC